LDGDVTIDLFVNSRVAAKDGTVTAATLDDVLSVVVFELFNMENDSRFKELEDAVRKGKLLRDDYCFAVACAEFRARVKTRNWYATVFRPWADRNGVVTRPQSWPCECAETVADEAVERWSREGYPYWVYGLKYDVLKGTAGSGELQRMLEETKEELRQGRDKARRLRQELERSRGGRNGAAQE
jgi:hypothetical protein